MKNVTVTADAQQNLPTHAADPVIWQENGFMARTTAHGLVYLDPMPEKTAFDQTAEYHAGGYYRFPAETRLKWVQRFVSQGELLEVGAGCGAFLEKARSAGFEAVAMEPQPVLAQHLRTCGFETEAVPLEDQSGTRRFDVVFHVDMISHFFDPGHALRCMQERLKPTGVLCFEVGVLGGMSPFWYRMMGGVGFPQHRRLFSNPALMGLFAASGLEVIETRRFGLLGGVLLVRLRRMLWPLLKRRVSFQNPIHDPLAAQPKLHQAYDYLQYLLRYKLGRWMPNVGPQTLFVAARPKSQAGASIFLANTTTLLADDYLHLMQPMADQNVPVYAWTPDPSKPGENPFQGDAKLEQLPFDRRAMNPFSVWRSLHHAWRMGRYHPNAVFTLITAIPHLLYGVPLRLRNAKLVMLMAGMGTLFSSRKWQHRLAGWVAKRLYRWIYAGKNTRILVQNREDQQYVSARLGADPRKVALMPGCGAEVSKFPFFPDLPQNNVILVPARIIIEKGIREAVSASQILRDRGIQHEMRFTSSIDPGNPMPLSQKQLEEIQDQNSWIRFVGYQPTMKPMFEQANVVCLPTYREGLPSALIEASACGRPIVTTDVIGCRDIVAHEKTGLLVPPRDPIALANALERLLTDRTLALRLRDAAYQQFLTHFTKDASFESTRATYRDLGLPL